MGTIKESAKRYSLPVSVILAGFAYLTHLSDNKHAEAMALINAKIEKDSSRQSDYQVFNNNKMDEQECKDKIQDSVIKNKTNCKN